MSSGGGRFSCRVFGALHWTKGKRHQTTAVFLRTIDIVIPPDRRLRRPSAALAARLHQASCGAQVRATKPPYPRTPILQNKRGCGTQTGTQTQGGYTSPKQRPLQHNQYFFHTLSPNCVHGGEVSTRGLGKPTRVVGGINHLGSPLRCTRCSTGRLP